MGRKKRERKGHLVSAALPFFQGNNYLELPKLHTFDSDSYLYLCVLTLFCYVSVHFLLHIYLSHGRTNIQQENPKLRSALE